MNRFIFSLAVLAIFGSAFSQEVKSSKDQEEVFQKVGKELAKGGGIELKALEIRAKIYEPQVLYVLDRAKREIDLKEDPVEFSSRIEVPILSNRLE